MMFYTIALLMKGFELDWLRIGYSQHVSISESHNGLLSYRVIITLRINPTIPLRTFDRIIAI